MLQEIAEQHLQLCKELKHSFMKQLFLSLLCLLMVADVSPQAILSKKNAEAILYMREEEKLARDLYDSIFRKWNILPFSNIRQSEQYHMDRVKSLVDRYNLKDPVTGNNDQPGKFTNSKLQQFYNELIAAGSGSLTGALKAGARIEETDIADLQERIKETSQQDIIDVYTYLKMASENHLRAFYRLLNNRGIQYSPVVLRKDEFEKIIRSNNRGGKSRGRHNW